uniref:Uncharacterized protein n=1 Tax=Oryza brachyantha TaxID=4533 RepID=J3MGU0_ORYBR
MATRAPPLLLCLCLCLASCSSSRSEELAAAGVTGNGYYRTEAFLVDEEGRRLPAELAAVAGAGGGSTAYGDDAQRLDVYASLYDYSLAVSTKTGKRVTLPAPADTVNVHVAGGNILPLQQPALTSSRVRQSMFHLLVALADDGTASGDLFLDDGESPEMVGARSRWSHVKFSGATEDGGVVRVRSHVVHDAYAPSRTLVIGKVVLTGLQSPAPPKGFAVHVNGVPVNASTAAGSAAGDAKNGALGTVHVGGLSLAVGQEFDLKLVMTY